jgi:hypothetical protein
MQLLLESGREQVQGLGVPSSQIIESKSRSCNLVRVSHSLWLTDVVMPMRSHPTLDLAPASCLVSVVSVLTFFCREREPLCSPSFSPPCRYVLVANALYSRFELFLCRL